MHKPQLKQHHFQNNNWDKIGNAIASNAMAGLLMHKRTVILTTLVTVFMIGCNDAENTKKDDKEMVAVSPDTQLKSKQDGSSGYALVNGLKIYYEIHIANGAVAQG